MRLYLGLIVFFFVGLAGCAGSSPNDPAEPVFSPQLFSARSATVANKYFPLVPGTVQTYQAKTQDSIEIIVVEVLEKTRMVAGVECAAVRDRVYEDDLLIEDTEDWYAQDQAGNVWYMGETVVNFEYDDDGNLIGTDSEGAWEAGADVAGIGEIAQPGIIMKASPRPGDSYQQEFYRGEAEDTARIVALNVSVTLADGTVHSCLQTRDLNPLDPGPDEFKYYAAGIGVVREEKVDGSENSELRGTFDLDVAAGLPDFSAVTFSNPSQITNLRLAFFPETARAFADSDEEDPEKIVVEALTTTRMVNGIECAVVRDRVFLGDLLIEDTHDWYAQDDAGNVWYMGESVDNYEYDDDGNLLGIDSDGAWEAGVDGAQPGIIMGASPVVGVSYRQEYYEDEAEDMAVIVAFNVEVELGDGTIYSNCLQILEWSELAPDALEYKYYVPGTGVVLEKPIGIDERVELTGP